MSNKNEESIAATQLAGVQASIGVTMLAGGPADQVALKQAEQAVGFEWKPGDVILDLYEVRKVTEGFGEDAEEKDFHEGGFGRVYKVWHRTWRREMAVKTPKAGAFKTQDQKDAFTRECETWIHLGLHPHIAACHYVRDLGGAPRVFSEYAEASTLENWISSKRLYEGDEKTALARMLDVAIQFAWGLHASHEKCVVHQDVKPLNALMWNDGTLKVTDFGLAGARTEAGVVNTEPNLESKQRSIMVSTGGMTPSHCSPEQAAGQKLDRRTDVWSWAVSVLEVFQGEVTWQAGTMAAKVLEAFLEHNGEEEGIPTMPAGVAALLRQCFQHIPVDRPHSLRDCAVALREVYQAENGKPYPRTEPPPIADTPDTLNNRALSFIDLGKPDEAERLFGRSLELDKHHVAATYNRGLILWRAAKITDSDVLQSLDEIAKDDDGNWRLHWALGWAWMECGEFAQAVVEFEKVVEGSDGHEISTILDRARSLAAAIGDYRRNWAGHKRRVTVVTFVADGKTAFSASFDKTVMKWEVPLGTCVSCYEGGWDVNDYVAFLPDGRRAISGGKLPVLRLWEVETGRLVRSFEGHRKNIRSIALSSDGLFALSGSDDNTLRLWDLEEGSCLRTFEGHSGQVSSVAFSADGRLALSGSWDKTLKLWDLERCHCLRTFEGHEAFVHAAVLSSNGHFAVSGGGSSTEVGELLLWDADSGRRLRDLVGHKAQITAVAFSPDARFVLSGSGTSGDRGELKLWETATGRCMRSFAGHSGCRVSAATFSPDGRFVLSGGGDDSSYRAPGELRLWQVATIRERLLAPWFYSMLTGVEEALERQHVHDDRLARAQSALAAGQIATALEYVTQARAVPGFERSPPSLELQARIGARCRARACRSAWVRATFEGHQQFINDVALSPDGRFALSGSSNPLGADRTLKLWDVATSRCLHAFNGHSDGVSAVAFSPDSRFALSGQGQTLKLWTVDTGQCLHTFDGHTKDVNDVAFSPDGRFALSAAGCGDEPGELKLWDMESRHHLRNLKGHKRCVEAVSFSPDGCFAVSGSDDDTLRLWRVSTGRTVRAFAESAGWPKSVAFSPNGRFILSGGWDKLLRLWDVETGRCLRTFERQVDGEALSNINSVAFSPDGSYALSGSRNSTLRLWDVETGRCLRILEGHSQSVTAAAFSPCGRLALSGSEDGALKLWELDWQYAYDPLYDPVLRSQAMGDEPPRARGLWGAMVTLFGGGKTK